MRKRTCESSEVFQHEKVVRLFPSIQIAIFELTLSKNKLKGEGYGTRFSFLPFLHLFAFDQPPHDVCIGSFSDERTAQEEEVRDWSCEYDISRDLHVVRVVLH